MPDSDAEDELKVVTDILVEELISLTPVSMSEIQFEIVSTEDGGADIGLLETHPNVRRVALSRLIYTYASEYLPLVRQYVPGWSRTVFVLRETDGEWQATVNFECGG